MSDILESMLQSFREARKHAKPELLEPHEQRERLERMLVALRESRSQPTKLGAGQVLCEGGWAVFPLPNMAKKDTKIWFEHATIDPGLFTAAADEIMRIYECRDVNVGVTPGWSAVPLVGIDLDGADAIQSFWDEAQSNGHVDVPLWLRVNTTRPDHGRHIYFVAPQGESYSNAGHGWGGETRSTNGHLVMPPSTTELGTYTWAGEKLYEAPPWVLNKLTPAGTRKHSTVSDGEINTLLEELSEHETNEYGAMILERCLEELEAAGMGGRAGHANVGRNATLARIVNRLLDMAVDRDVNALEAIDRISRTYLTLFSREEEQARHPAGEVIRCVRSWARNKDDIPTLIELRDACLAWARARSMSPQLQTYASDVRRAGHEVAKSDGLREYSASLKKYGADIWKGTQ